MKISTSNIIECYVYAKSNLNLSIPIKDGFKDCTVLNQIKLKNLENVSFVLI